jgi:hypothetical protein
MIPEPRPRRRGMPATMTTFRSTVTLGGKTATGIEVPPEVIAELGPQKRPPVRVTVAGYTYRTTVGVMAGRFMLPLSADHRAASGLQAGDEVEVALELDTEPREVAVPADLAEALAHHPEAAAAFAPLSYSHKRRHVLAIEDAKTAETRQRRIEKCIAMLATGGG